jgi:hypothetical protein
MGSPGTITINRWCDGFALLGFVLILFLILFLIVNLSLTFAHAFTLQRIARAISRMTVGSAFQPG